MKPDFPREQGVSPRQSHGPCTLKRAVRTLGRRTIDRRTKVGRALAAWSEDLARDLGDVDALSTAQKTIIEQAATTRLLLDSIDGWLVTQRSLVDKRKRALLPVVRNGKPSPTRCCAISRRSASSDRPVPWRRLKAT